MVMGSSIIPTGLVSPCSPAVYGGRATERLNSGIYLTSKNGYKNDSLIKARRLRIMRTAVINEVSAAADPAQAEITWQIVVGTLAGVTPFVVAGIEFSKRIVAQRRCGVCGGSGLVLRDKYYFRCPTCGGFLPWQSWKRFFSG